MFNLKREGNEIRELSYKDNKCVGCGICVDVCPTESLNLGPVLSIARGLNENDKLDLNSDTCVLCGLCSVACPFDSLSLTIEGKSIKNSDSYPYWDVESNVDNDNCVYCGRCFKICPSDAILFERNLPDIKDILSGEISIDDEECIYCGFCEELCPAGAISIDDVPKSRNEKLNKIINVDSSKCIYCGICKRICPQGAVREICSTCMMQDEIKIPEITGNTFITENSCVSCSWCSHICPNDAINVTKPFTGTLELAESEDKQCMNESCHACIDVCPCNAITLNDQKAVADMDYCNLCGACAVVCPQDIRVLKRESMNLININSESWKNILNKLLVAK